MSLSGDKGVAQFKKSVKMGHPTLHLCPLLDPQVDEFQCKNGSCVPLENKYVGSPQCVHDKVTMPCFGLSKGLSSDD